MDLGFAGITQSRRFVPPCHYTPLYNTACHCTYSALDTAVEYLRESPQVRAILRPTSLTPSPPTHSRYQQPFATVALNPTPLFIVKADCPRLAGPSGCSLGWLAFSGYINSLSLLPLEDGCYGHDW